MDMGGKWYSRLMYCWVLIIPSPVYTLSIARLLASSNPTEVKSVALELAPGDKRVDFSTTAELVFPNDVTATVYCNFEEPPWLGFIPTMPKIGVTVKLEGGIVELSNYPGPHHFHRIRIQENVKGKIKKSEETAYTFSEGPVKGEEYWTTSVSGSQ